MAAANRIDDNESTPAIGSSLKIELKPNSVANRASSPSALLQNSLKSYQDSSRSARLLHPSAPAKQNTKAAQIRDEIVSELIGPEARAPEYAPQEDELAIGPSPEPAHEAGDTVSIKSLEPPQKPRKKAAAPLRTFKPPVARAKAPVLNHALVLYYYSLSMVFSAAIFLAFYLIMQIPGSTVVNTLSLYAGLQISLAPIPLWFNSGCILLAVIFMVRILLYSGKYGLGLVIGIPVGLNTVLSLYIEGFVGNGIAFALCISTVSLLCLITAGKIRLKPEETTLISMVAGLSVIPLTGYIIHFFAGLMIGVAVLMFSQIVLLLFVELRRYR